MFQSSSRHSIKQSTAHNSSRPTATKLKGVFDTISNWFENRRPQRTQISILTSSVIYYWTDAQQHGIYLLKRGNVVRVPFDQNFRKFRFKIKWNRKFPETYLENFGQPLEIVLFSGNLEIPEIFRSIWHFYPVWVGPSSSSRAWKLQDGGESILHWLQNDLSQSEAFIDCLSFSKTLGSAFLKNCRLFAPNFPWAFARFAQSPARQVRKFISHYNPPINFRAILLATLRHVLDSY